MKTVHQISEAGFRGGGVFAVEGSQFLSWLAEESYQVRDAKAMKHFCVMTLNSIIDVVAIKDPDFVQCP